MSSVWYLFQIMHIYMFLFFQTISVTESEVVGIQPKSAMGITFQVNGCQNVVKQTHSLCKCTGWLLRTSYD